MATEYEKNKELHKKLNQAQKIREDIITSEELQGEEAAAIGAPTTFKGKLTNWWYHYKIPFFIILVALIVLITFVVGVFSDKTQYDVSFTIVAEQSFIGSDEVMRTALYPYADAYKTGSGTHAKIDYEAYFIPENPYSTTIDIEFLKNEKAKLMGRLSTNNAYIYLLDEYNYKQLKESYEMQFLDLSKLSDSKQIKGDKFMLEGSKLAKQMQIEGITSGMFLCIIDFDCYTDKAKSDKKIVAFKDREYAFFKDMIKVDE